MRHLAEQCATCGHRGDVHSGDYCRHLECTYGLPGACAGCNPVECGCTGFTPPVEAEEFHPPPAIPATLVEPLDEVVPGGARKLIAHGKRHGWTLERLSYARGTSLDAYGRPSTVKDHVALRMSQGDKRAVGTWANGVAESFYFYEAGELSFKIGATPLKARMKGETE